MSIIIPKVLPKFECLQRMAQLFPQVDPSAIHALLALMRLYGDLEAAFTAHFNRHGLSQGRFIVLMLLLRESHESPGTPALSPSELADLAGVTRATMTGLLDGLERDGMVQRVPDPGDRRTIDIELTPKAREFLAAMLPDHFKRESLLMAALSHEERDQLVALLAKVSSGLGAVLNP